MRSAFLSLALTLPLTALASTAMAENTSQLARPITTYQWVGPDEADISEPQSHTSNIIYLNRCKGGCSISPGNNDSRTNRSSIIRSTANIPEWNKGDEEWEALVNCVSAMYDPFDIVITDVDPGQSVEHFEAIVAGTAASIGANPNIGGIAPFSCGIINNAITFSFANASFYANGIDGICETVAQETAHAFGLEHEFLCSDPMTYLQPCGYKWFNDVGADCGEYEPTACQCTGGRQNSYQRLSSHFGLGENPGPKLGFVRPLANTNVNGSFVIEVSGSDYYYGVNDVELFIDGQSQGISNSPPYIFNAPEGLEGFTEIEVRAIDGRGVVGSSKIEINVGAGCTPGGCSDDRVCYKGFCIEGETAASGGGFGANCTEGDTCNSGLCPKDADGTGTCTETCDLNADQCPAGFGCLKVNDDTNVCWAGVSEDPGGCGCSSSNNGAGGLASLLFVMMGLAFQRRRKQN